MHSIAEAAASDLNHAVTRLQELLARTPDDLLSWSPSESARNALQLVAHSAFALGFIREMLEGSPYPAPTTEAADLEFLEMEKQVDTREKASSLLNDRRDAYIAFLGTLTREHMTQSLQMPFQLGSIRLEHALPIGAMHTRHHIAQLEYLQTIYGDRVW